MPEQTTNLSAAGPAPRPNPRGRPWEVGVLAQIESVGVGFAGSDPRMTARWQAAIEALLGCIKPTVDDEAVILNEGGVYYGCWLESTGTINTELLSRFASAVAHDTFAGFFAHQRADGCLPYKLTTDGPVFSQIQLVTPPARSIHTHCGLHGDAALLAQAYTGLSAYDDWLAAFRDTRGTGAVEAFCTFDTGHDLSPRFWHIPDSPHDNEPTTVRPAHPTLPFVAPDLTAATICGRRYLAKMANALGHDPAPWAAKAEAMEAALFEQCWDEADGTFYDAMPPARWCGCNRMCSCACWPARLATRRFLSGRCAITCSRRASSSPNTPSPPSRWMTRALTRISSTIPGPARRTCSA